MNEIDRNILGITFAQVEVMTDKSRHILCRLEDFEFDRNTILEDILRKMHDDDKLCLEYDVVVTMHSSSQLKDCEASPVKSLEKFVHLYHAPNLRYIKFTATPKSEVPAPPQKRRCINSVLTHNLNSHFTMYNPNSTASNNLLLPNKFDENKELNAKHKIYNNLLQHFGVKKLGWMENEHESTFRRREKNGDKRQGHGAQFIDKLSGLLSLISQHKESLQKYFKYADWINNVIVIKSSRKRNMETLEIKHAVSQLRATIRGQWINFNCWKDYLNDVFHLMKSLEKYCEKRDTEAEAQRKIRTSEAPARGPDNCKILTTTYVGKVGYIQDFRHKKISQILKSYPPFKPYFVPEPLYYYGHDILNITLRKKPIFAILS